MSCLSIQGATLAVAQYLTAESSRPVEEEPMVSSVDASVLAAFMPPPTPTQPIVTRFQKPRKTKQAPPPPAPVVAQLIEMGFSRKKVEIAVKALGELHDCLVQLRVRWNKVAISHQIQTWIHSK